MRPRGPSQAVGDRFFDDLGRCSRDERRRLLRTSLSRNFGEDLRGTRVDVDRIFIKLMFLSEVHDERRAAFDPEAKYQKERGR